MSTDLLQSNLLLIGEVSSCRCGKLGVPKYPYLVRNTCYASVMANTELFR